MKNSRHIAMLLTMVALTPVVSTVFSAVEDNWHDTFYQYRIPVVMEARKEGWNVVPITESDLTSRVNRSEEMKYDPLFFAHNQLKVVEVDDDGKVINPDPTAGFFIAPDSEELIKEPLTGKEQEIRIPTEARAYYLAKYTAEGGGKSPLYEYVQIHPVESRKNNKYLSSYEAPLIQKKVTAHERLLISDGQPMIIKAKNRWVSGLKEISVKKVKIVFLANVKKPGKHHYMFYYQPMCAWHLTIPSLKHSEIPANSAKVKRIGFAEKYTGTTQYCLGSNNNFDIWFAETTVKLTPNTPVPEKNSSEIKITSAKNEAQSFQVVLNPKKTFGFKKVTASDLISSCCGNVL